MKKNVILSIFVLLVCASITFGWGTSKGFSYHKVQFVDEYDRVRTDINSVTIRTAASTAAQTIYKDEDRTAITQPILEASTNTTLDRTTGTVYWYGGVDAWDFTATLDSGIIYANNGHISLNSNMNRIIFPSYLAAVNTSTFTLTDAQVITLGTDSDWTIKSNTAKTLNILPAAGDETYIVNIGANTAGADLKLFGATTGSYALWDSSEDSLILVGSPLTATGAAVNLNASSNFAVNIASGTSTGTVTVGGTGAQTIAIGTGGTGAKTIGIGDGASTGTTTIKGGSGGVAVNASNGTVATNIGTGTSTGTVTIGSATTTQAVAINAGTGDLALTSTDDITLTTNTAVTDNIVITNTQGTAATAISLQATAGGIDVDGGSGADISITSTGKSVSVTATEAATDAIALTATTGAGGITASSGSGGINLNASVNQPVNIGTGTSSGTITLGGGSGLLAIATSSWDVASDGTMTNIGAITSGGLFTGTAGETITGANINLNASSNFNTNINTGTSTGAVSIGSSTSGAFAVDTTSTVAVNADASQAYTVTDTVAGNAFTWDTTDGGMAFTAAGAANGDFAVSAADDISIAAADDLAITSAGTLGVGANAVEQLVTIGNETGASSLTLKAGTGNIDIQGVAASTITIGDAAQTAAITIGASTATMTDLSLGTGVGAHTIHIGDGGTAAQVITMGSTSAASAVTIQSGTGDVSITSADDFTTSASGAVALFSNAVEQTITLGNETSASSLALKAGTGNITMEGIAATTITIGDAAQTGTMKFGESSATCEIDLATGNGAKTVNLGVGTGINAVNIGTGGTGAKTIIVGDGASTGTTTVTAGSGGLSLPAAATTIGDAIGDITTFTGKIAGATPMSFDGATANTAYTILAVADVGSSITVTLPNSTSALIGSTLTTNNVDVANSIWFGTSQIIAEGATADESEATLAFTDPTADVIFTFPVMAAQTVSVMTSTLATNAPDIANSVWGGTNGLVFEGATGGADAFETSLTVTDPTADRTITLPNKTGEVKLSSAAVALTTTATAVPLTVGLSNIYTDTIVTDNNDQTITFSGAGTAGDELTIIFTTDTGGSGDEIITFESTLVTSTGTLTLANATAKSYLITFISNGTRWYEKSRTAISTSP